jgi:DNA anti-recombination protein RmuC
MTGDVEKRHDTATPKNASQARPGNQNALRHGANSPSQTKAKARAHRRRFLRRLGVRASDLDAVTSELLRSWADAQAKVDSLAEARDRVWVAAHNSAAKAFDKLSDRIAVLGLDRLQVVSDPTDALATTGRQARERWEAEQTRARPSSLPGGSSATTGGGSAPPLKSSDEKENQ